MAWARPPPSSPCFPLWIWRPWRYWWFRERSRYDHYPWRWSKQLLAITFFDSLESPCLKTYASWCSFFEIPWSCQSCCRFWDRYCINYACCSPPLVPLCPTLPVFLPWQCPATPGLKSKGPSSLEISFAKDQPWSRSLPWETLFSCLGYSRHLSIYPNRFQWSTHH